MQLSAGMGWQAWIFCMVMMITIRSSPTGVLRLFDRFDTGAFAETMIPVGRMIGAALAWMLMPNVTGFLIAWGAAELLCAISYRSEEHTSELQSLMRISYAVFCLNKKHIHSPTSPTNKTSMNKY